MTAVLPETAPANPGRHRAPDGATTGSLGALPADRRSRAAHAPRHGVPAPVHRAAKTAGLSLVALGALATAGGAAAHSFTAADEPASTGEFSMDPKLASSDLTVTPKSGDVAAPAVMPVVSESKSTQGGYKHDSPVSRASSSKTSGAKDEKSSTGAAKETPAVGSSAGAKALAAAKNQLGVPYVWGGTSPSGFDCSGLMQYAFEKAGKDLPRTSRAQAQEGKSVERSELQPGDLIFINSPISHVVMYAGNGQIIEAPTEGEDVKMSKLSQYDGDITAMKRV